MCFNWNTDGKSASHCSYLHASIAILINMHPYLAKESYTYLVSSLYIMAFATRSGGRILHAQTYPLQEVDAEEGDGRLIRGGRLIRTIRYCDRKV